MTRIRYKIGDYIRDEDSIGRIIDKCATYRPVEWKVDIISLCAGGGLVRTMIFRSPLYLSINYEPAKEEDFLKAVKLVKTSEISFRALMNRVKQPQ